MLNLFGKNKTSKKPAKEKPAVSAAVMPVTKPALPAASILEHLYVSEKASHLTGMNHYVFKVASGATKNEIKKQVASRYQVKVKDVRVMNTHGKERRIGRHAGFRPGFRKAIVVLHEGNTIEQAKP